MTEDLSRMGIEIENNEMLKVFLDSQKYTTI